MLCIDGTKYIHRMNTCTQVICSPPEDQRIPFKTLKGYWDYQLALDKYVDGSISCVCICTCVGSLKICALVDV